MGHSMFPNHALIDIFHMPLFFILAGITFSCHGWGKFLVSKTNRILIPFLFFTALSFILSQIPHPYTGPFNGPLWFLQAILIALLIMQLISKVKLQLQLLVSLFLLAFAFIFHKNHDSTLLFDLERGITSYIYIYIGYNLKKYFKRSESPRALLTSLIVLSSLFFTIFGFIYYIDGYPGQYFNMTMFNHDLFLVAICSLLGSAMVIQGSKLLSNSKFLAYCGKNSLVIMCVHFPICQLLNIFISKLSIYPLLWGKIVLMVTEWSIVLGFALACAHVCKRYIPKLAGYSPMVMLTQKKWFA